MLYVHYAANFSYFSGCAKLIWLYGLVAGEGIEVIDLCFVKFDQRRWFFCDYEILITIIFCWRRLCRNVISGIFQMKALDLFH